MNLNTLQLSIKPTPLVQSNLDNLATIYYGQSGILNNTTITKPAVTSSCKFELCSTQYRESLPSASRTEIAFSGWIYNDSAMHGREDLPFLYERHFAYPHSDTRYVAESMFWFKTDGTLRYEMYPHLSDEIYNYRGGEIVQIPPSDEWIFITIVGNVNGAIFFGWKTAQDEAHHVRDTDATSKDLIWFDSCVCPSIREDYQMSNIVVGGEVTYADPYKYFDISTMDSPNGLIDFSNSLYFGEPMKTTCTSTSTNTNVSGIPIKSLR